jgi:hypothetical protein
MKPMLATSAVISTGRSLRSAPLTHRVFDRAPVFAQTIDRRDHHHAVQDRHSKERDEANSRGDREGHPAQREGHDAADDGERDAGADQQRLTRRMKRRN